MSGKWPCETCTYENEPVYKSCEMCQTKKQTDAVAKVSELVVEMKLDGGTSLQVRHGDLTVEPVDAIVNAANERLDHASGLAGAIIKRGGQSIQEESDEIYHSSGKTLEGNVAVTGSGNLSCKIVIHAVGPIWNTGNDGEPLLLQMAVRNSLEKALELNLKSIAIPAISSGIFRFPKQLCAEIMIDTCVEFAKQNPDGLLEIHLTNFDRETVDIFAAELKKRK